LIHGQATNEWGCVRVFGTPHRSNQFHLTLKSDVDVAQAWEEIKTLEFLLHRDGERRRFRDLQHEFFDKSPPTATLSSPWDLECQIPPAVFDQLSSDLAATRVDKARLNIECPFAFVEKETGEWGFFEEDTLRGYVSSFTWSLQTEAAALK